jgi:hypothetical protein
MHHRHHVRCSQSENEVAPRETPLQCKSPHLLAMSLPSCIARLASWATLTFRRDVRGVLYGAGCFDDCVIGPRLVAHTEAGAAREHACCDVHSEEFLEEQFSSIGNVDL